MRQWASLWLEGLWSSTDPSACSGEKTACTVFSVEPSPMAAKATRFCFRTLRTKPLMVRVSPDGAPSCGDVGDKDGGLSSAAILVGEKVELQRRRHGHCACEYGMAVARRRGNNNGRRKARPRTRRLVLIDATTTSQSAVKQLLAQLSCDIEAM